MPWRNSAVPRLSCCLEPFFHFQLGRRLCLGPAKDVLVDGLACLGIMPCGIPPSIFSLSDVTFAVDLFLHHSIRLLFNDTIYHRKKK